MKKKEIILFFIVLFIGIILRFWQLGSVPISPDWDEAALGYNAYSIIHTGRDEYGEFLPIVMRSFDDYKPALYAYFTIPSVLIFGLNTMTTRLPSAFFGILSVIAVYFLLKELFEDSKFKSNLFGFNFDIPIIGMLLLSISPWHIQFSRIAFESNVGLAFNIFMALFFIKGIKKSWMLNFSAISAALAIYVYQSEKVFTPLLALALVIIYRKELLSKSRKHLILPVIIGFILILPMLFYTVTNKNALQRAQGVSIFSQKTDQLEQNTLRLLADRENKDILGLVLDNRRILFAKEVASGYLSHFDLNWLFINGDISRHHAPHMGLLYIFELPFIFIGIYMLLFGSFKRQTKLIIFSWLLLAPVPASVTSGVPHAVRALNLLPTWQIFIAIGVIGSILLISKLRFSKVIIFAYFLFALFNFVYYLNQYFVQQNYFTAIDWQYGYEKIISQVEKESLSYKKIVVSNQAPMDQSYMFFLFYLKYPPELYQAVSSSGGFRENHSFGKYEFRPIDWKSDQNMPDTLFVGRPSDFGENAEIINYVDYPNGNRAMEIAH